MVAFYITFMEDDMGEPSTVEFAYVYCIKALARNESFGYTSKWGPDIVGVWGVNDNMGNYKDRYFFYAFDRFGDFRIASE